ncbi:MAG: UDP-glucose/GDP-mannose dehydrogenase family protein, partial [Candidatus Caldarchaeum sp.]|nr:UDP-glucose/GDP-mannose dehydrogenase family protein [Candidatus Caldarchaeum sp.]
MKLAFIGLGYVGLTTAVCMAYRGFDVVGVEVDDEKVEKISRGIAPVKEPKLEKLLKYALSRKKFTASTSYRDAVKADVFFITVGTPSKPDGGIDLSRVAEACKHIGETLATQEKVATVAVKSTVVPGTTRTLVKQKLEEASQKKVGMDLNLCVNPEFLREGAAVDDTFHPDRIVIGDDWGRGGKILTRLYKKFYGRKTPPTMITNTVNAEMIKYASNVFLAARISLINEVANICQRTPGADVEEVAKGIGMDRRIGPHFLRAGLGYGGSCFPKDVKALAAFAKSLGVEPCMLESVQKVNDNQPYKAIELAERLVGNLHGRKAAVLGLSFKPNTDDIREAVSLKIINKLLEHGCTVVAYDPAATENVRRLLGNKINYAESAEECIKNADFCIVATEWDEFRRLKPEVFKKHMKKPVVIDGRRVYDPAAIS